jgi:microcystin-dependent protein
MASTYSPNLRLELITTGEQQGTWGSTTNKNLGTLLEEAIGGYVSVGVTDGADTTLTSIDGSADQSRNMVINLTGALTATRNVICPAIEKLYVVKNATTGGFAVTFKVSGQTGVSIPNGSTYFLYVDGTMGDARQITGSMAIQNSDNVSITGGSIVANASSLSVRDSDGSNILSIAVGSNLTSNTVLTLTTGATSNRTLDISASNVTVSIAGAALIDDADASAQRTTLGLGTIATQNANAVSITGGSVTGITDLALADGGTGASLTDPNANAVLGWNDTAGAMIFFTAGTGVTINATSNTISSSAASIIPVGSLMPYAGTSAPTGWTLCFGQAVSRTTFADLFAVVGTTYGIGDGSTTFNLPDLRGRVVAGKDDMGGTSANRLTGLSGGVNGDVLGAAGGAEIHTLTTAEMPSHTHTITYGVDDVNGGGGTFPSYLEDTGRTETANATGGGGAHNNVQPTFILNYIIKN